MTASVKLYKFTSFFGELYPFTVSQNCLKRIKTVVLSLFECKSSEFLFSFVVFLFQKMVSAHIYICVCVCVYVCVCVCVCVCVTVNEKTKYFFHFLRKLGFSRTDKYKKRRIDCRKHNCIISNRCDFISI